MTDGRALLEAVRAARGSMIEGLREVVEHETPSLDKGALDRMARRLARGFEARGGRVALVENKAGGDHVRAAFGPDGPAAPTVVLAHFDTVWPSGTIGRMPFRVEGDRAFGPGVFDMKASLVMVASAIDAIRSAGLLLPRPVVVLATSDEEIGSPRSRALLEAEAAAGAQTLVLEPPLADGSLKTGRKGVGHFVVSVEGRASHAGVEPEKGANAIVEMAHQVLALGSIARPELGTTINPGVVSGGTASNVVPAHASIVVDARAVRLDEAARVEAEMAALRAVTPGTRVHAVGAFDRPPMERTEAVAGLYARVRAIGATIGLDLGEGSTGGASDANFTAALGVPTIDGLGCPGGGAHAESEHILLDGLVERTALLALLLMEL